ncbi:MAG TPA: hypothetical protein ENI79_00650, partial [Rhodospirillales bacterium]|nr:hypothetical protein [Rhodospirillales bacterium]
MFELEINLRCKTIQGEQEFSVFDGERLAAKARTFSDGLFSTWFSGFNVTPEYERFRIGQLLIKMIDDRFPHTAVFVNASKTQTPAFIDSGFVVKRQLICCQRLRRCSIVETSKGFSDNQRGVEKSEMAMENENIRIEETTANVTQDALTNVYVSVNFGKHENYKDLHDMVAGMFGPGVFGFFAFDNENLIGLARVYS